MTVELMPHQEEAIQNLDNGKILWGGVGSGKSMTVLAYYMLREAPRDIYVITTAKKRDSLDWEGEAIHFGISTERQFCVPGVGKITVDSWNNVFKYIDVEDAFFIFDEQRVIGMGEWGKNFIKIAKQNRWVMCTATPGDIWLDYIPVFIANHLYRNATEFKREHVEYAPFSKFPKVVRYRRVSTLEKYRNMLLVEMPYLRHTKRIIEEIICKHDKEMMDMVIKKRWHVFEDRPIRDVGEFFRVMRKVVNTDPDRIVKLKELLETHPRIIVFYNFDYELDILRGLSDYVEVAEWNGHRKQPIPSGQKWVYLVQYVAGAEGWNCIETNSTVFYSMTYSYKNLEQGMGRTDRLNTKFTELYYYLFMSDTIIDKSVRKSQLSKELFSESAHAKTMGFV